MIGIYDSGLGGLTALRELRIRRPDLDILYFGDTAHLPYGTRSPETLLRYARRALSFLTAHGADSILVACGTVSSVVLPTLQTETSLPLYGVVTPAAEVAYALSRNKKIGVIATDATVRSGAFETALRRLGTVAPFSRACPLLVSLVENGFTGQNDPVARAACEHYLSPFQTANIDTLILGCTHFPLLAHHIHRALPRVTLVGAGEAAAANLCATCPAVGQGRTQLYVSDDPQAFARQAVRFLGQDLPCPVRLWRYHSPV